MFFQLAKYGFSFKILLWNIHIFLKQKQEIKIYYSNFFTKDWSFFCIQFILLFFKVELFIYLIIIIIFIIINTISIFSTSCFLINFLFSYQIILLIELFFLKTDVITHLLDLHWYIIDSLYFSHDYINKIWTKLLEKNLFNFNIKIIDKK